MSNTPEKAIIVPVVTGNTSEETTNFKCNWAVLTSAKKIGEKLTSPIFIPKGYEELKWTMEFYPYGEDAESTQSTLYMRLEMDSEYNYSVIATFDFQISLRHYDTLTEYAKSENKFISFISTNLFECRTIFIEGQVSMCNRFLYYEEDSFEINCNITMRALNRNSIASMLQANFFHDMKHLFEAPKQSDVIIVASGREISAHKGILCARSPVFAAMFENELEEVKNNRIDIKDFEYEIVNEMLRFMYTGEVVGIKKMADRLLAAGDKYDIEALRILCCETLAKHITIENAAARLCLADLHSCDRLKKAAVEFISNHTTEVMETSGFQAISSNNDLLTEVLHGLAIKVKEMEGRNETSSKAPE